MKNLLLDLSGVFLKYVYQKIVVRQVPLLDERYITKLIIPEMFVTFL